MRQSYTIASKLFQIITTVLVMTGFFTLGVSKAKAGDRDDAKALVGYWQTTEFLGDDLEFQADGTYHFVHGLKGTWKVKDGKIVCTCIGDTTWDFTLTPDNNRLEMGKNSYKRKQ